MYHAGVHDSLMTLALVGAGGARILALGSQPRGGSTVRRRLSDVTAVHSSPVSFFFVFTDHFTVMRPFVYF